MLHIFVGYKYKLSVFILFVLLSKRAYCDLVYSMLNACTQFAQCMSSIAPRWNNEMIHANVVVV